MIKTFAQPWLEEFWHTGKNKRLPSELETRLLWCNTTKKEKTMLPRHRRPTPPGDILRHEFLEPLGLTQKELAAALGITRVRLSEIIRGRRAITPDTALRLSRFLGTTPEFWLGLQTDVQLWDTLQAHAAEYENIKPVKAA